MKIGELRTLIQKLGSVQEALGAKTPAKDLAAIDALFDGHEDQDIAQFVADAEAVLAAKAARNSNIKPVLNDEVVAEFIRRLSAENSAYGDFVTVFENLKSHKGVGAAEANAIATGFLGMDFGFTQKTEAFDEIHRRYIRDRQSESKRRIIEKVAI